VQLGLESVPPDTQLATVRGGWAEPFATNSGNRIASGNASPPDFSNPSDRKDFVFRARPRCYFDTFSPVVALHLVISWSSSCAMKRQTCAGTQ